MTGRFEVPQTRKQGRKIDTWTFSMPDDKVDIDVSMHTGSEGVRFIAHSRHPALAKSTWEETDITVLASEVERDVRALFGELQEERWKPVLVLEVFYDRSERSAQDSASLTIRTEPVLLDTETPAGNDGRRRIQKNGSVAITYERSPSDDVHIKAGERKYKLDTEGSRSLVSDTDATRAAAEALQDTLTRFGKLLAMRTSPAHANPDDMPTPEDLIELMRQAASGAAS